MRASSIGEVAWCGHDDPPAVRGDLALVAHKRPGDWRARAFLRAVIDPGDRAVQELERRLENPEESFYRLPAVALPESRTLRAALKGFRTHDVPAGTDAAAWLRDSALREHRSARTVLVVGRGRVWAYYALASSVVTMDEPQRRLAGVPGQRNRVPATLLAWIARDPEARVSGRALLADAIATCREANEFQATAVLVLDAHDASTAEMWLQRPFGLRRLREGGNRLWLPLSDS